MKIKKINIAVISIAIIWATGLFPGVRPAEAKEYKWKPLTSSHRAYQSREERAIKAKNKDEREMAAKREAKRWHNGILELQKKYIKELKLSRSRERRTMPYLYIKGSANLILTYSTSIFHFKLADPNTATSNAIYYLKTKA
jgi:glutaredoxin